MLYTCVYVCVSYATANYDFDFLFLLLSVPSPLPKVSHNFVIFDSIRSYIYQFTHSEVNHNFGIFDSIHSYTSLNSPANFPVYYFTFLNYIIRILLLDRWSSSIFPFCVIFLTFSSSYLQHIRFKSSTLQNVLDVLNIFIILLKIHFVFSKLKK